MTKTITVQGDPNDGKHSVQIDVGNTNLHIDLQNNDGIVPLSHIVDHHINDDDIQTYTGLPGRYSFGSVRGDNDSMVALGHNEGGYVSYQLRA